MEIIKKQKGTMDLYGEEGKTYVYIESIIHALCEKYNYNFIKTPTFEASELFHRGVGETTDIVTKETYDFKDRGDRQVTLKPEGTASVVRCFIENKMNNLPDQPLKFYYLTSVFRYERPQAGRLREHTQFGVEVFGSNSVLVDAEVISIAVNFYRLLGLKNLTVKINSLGDISSRLKYKEALLEYFKPHIDKLCHDCQTRYEKNPLRILDCKVDSESDIIKNAPKMSDYLNEDSKCRFNSLLEVLDDLEISYCVDDSLVRGLDYYNHTVFEVQANLEGFGKMTTLCGGGRYNSLVKTLGGEDTPAMGFGLGIERLLLILKELNIDLVSDNRLDLYIINLCTDKRVPLLLANDLRMSGFKVETDYLDRNLKSQFKSVDRLNPRYFTVIGDEEVEKRTIKIKDNDTKDEEEIGIDEIIDYMEGR